ncbi:protein FAM169B-like [Notolabrus celidotus]|uniref:protein FAM169B-like n=1 Tax=Notolabrus celidotus TaxID=1203425 RepID=UPI0014905B7C|nr:protein FAM169B-like [Notolabrus celidotus]
MLEDFCSSFSTEKFLGVSSPLSPSMVAVCRRFLLQHEEHQERLYEVEAPGDWTQQRNIWLNIQLGRYSLSTDTRSFYWFERGLIVKVTLKTILLCDHSVMRRLKE